MSSPTIKEVSATKTASSVIFITLLSNEGSQGMVSLQGYNQDTGTCILVGSRPICLFPNSEYINNLFTRVYLFFPDTQFNTGCVRAYACASGDDCANNTCSAYNSDPASSIQNIQISNALGITPNSVSNLSLSSGDRSIVASWVAPSNAPIFCYYVGLYQGGNLITSGYVTNTQITISNLTNGVQYTLEVAAVSDDNLSSGVVSRSATPGGCVDPNCTIYMQQPS